MVLFIRRNAEVSGFVQHMVETGVGGRSKVKVSSTKEGYAHRRDTDFRIHRNFTNLVSVRSRRHGFIYVKSSVMS